MVEHEERGLPWGSRDESPYNLQALAEGQKINIHTYIVYQFIL